jgi:hypothetical protein
MSGLEQTDQGCDIASIIDRRSGQELLFQTPWGRADRRYLPCYGDSRTAWMAAYGGGWQVLCPNAGPESAMGELCWGYHGEACLLPWTVLSAGDDSATLEVALRTVPVRLRRTLRVLEGILRVDEQLVNDSDVDVDLMWVQHPAFGLPLVGPGAQLEVSARTVRSDAEIACDSLVPGELWTWPDAVHRDGRPVDLRQLPQADEPRALLAYLEHFERHEAAIVNDRLGIAVTLRWSGDVWPHAWLWQEVNATREYPWFARAHAVAIEPATTIPGWGAAGAQANGGSLLHVGAATTVDAWIELAVSSEAVP